MEDKTESKIPNWFYAGMLGCYAAFLTFYIYDRMRDRPELDFSKLPFDPNREIRQEYERRAMEKQMEEWDAEV